MSLNCLLSKKQASESEYLHHVLLYTRVSNEKNALGIVSDPSSLLPADDPCVHKLPRTVKYSMLV